MVHRTLIFLLVCGCGDDDTSEMRDAARDADIDPDARTDRDADAGPLGDGGDADAGPPGDPQLVHIEDFEYAGAFRVPADDFGISSLNYAEGPIEIAPDRGSFFIVGHAQQQAVAEMTLPALVASTRIEDLNMAAPPTQTFVDLLARAAGNPQMIDRIGGLRYRNGELVVNGYEFYDAPGDNSHTTLVVRDATDLAASRVDGWFELDGAAHASGFITDVPEAYREVLGAPAIAGSSSGMPIIGRLSVGPSAFAIDPAAFTGATEGAIATTPLLDFDLEHPLADDLSNDTGENDLWTHLSRATYGFIVPGTRSYVTIGHSGGHGPMGVCYKCTPVGESEDCGGYCSVDPDDYDVFYWFFDVEDLARVKRGELMPHEVRPYAYGPFEPPFPATEIGGGAYDAASGLLYLTLQRADREQGKYANPPIVVAYRIR